MNSGISTEGRPGSGPTFHVWHFYLLLSMGGATVAVLLARDTHPAALLLLSAAVVAAGLVGLATHSALAGFLSRDQRPATRPGTTEWASLEREKALTLRSIKELEFDRAMGKIGDTDFAELDGRLRARALALMEAIASAAPVVRGEAAQNTVRLDPDTATCTKCGAVADADARFCKHCGARLAASRPSSA